MNLKSFKSVNYIVIIVGIGVLLISAIMTLPKQEKGQPAEDIFGFFEPREFIRGSEGVVLGDELKDQVLITTPRVEENIALPDFPRVFGEFNKIKETFRIGKTARSETRSFGDSLTETEEGYLYKHKNGLFQFNFDRGDKLKSIYFTNFSDNGFLLSDINSLLGKPEFIIKISPFSPKYYEYIYAYKGITFFFETPEKPIKALVIYKPQTLEDYHKNYVRLFPFYYR